MRVAVVTESFLPSVNGVTNSVLRILEFFDSFGHDAIVVAPDCPGKSIDYLGYKVKHVPSIGIKRILPIGIPSRTIRHFLDGFNPDVIHLASPAILGTYVAKISHNAEIPTLSVYQTDIAGFAKCYGMMLGNNSIKKAVAKIHSSTSRTLAPSSSAANDLQILGVPNVHIWPRGIDLQRFNPSHRDQTLRNSWLRNEKRYMVGYVGRIAKEKGLDRFEEIYSHPQVQLTFIGDGPEKSRLEKKFPDANFLGMLFGKELSRAVASLDFFVHTGLKETFCQSIQEALASGIPVIAPAVGGPLDLVQDGINGFLFDGNTKRSLSDAFELLLNSDIESLEFAARESVLGRDWETINKQLLDHYKAIISDHDRKSAA